jgi:hypothetical protein
MLSVISTRLPPAGPALHHVMSAKDYVMVHDVRDEPWLLRHPGTDEHEESLQRRPGLIRDHIHLSGSVQREEVVPIHGIPIRQGRGRVVEERMAVSTQRFQQMPFPAERRSVRGVFPTSESVGCGHE